jgi:CBS domain containing-hemolysin-like protein
MVPGTLSLRRIEQEIPELKFPDSSSYDNLAGLILDRLGEIPQPGAVINLDNLELKVEQTSRNRIIKVRITRLL